MAWSDAYIQPSKFSDLIASNPAWYSALSALNPILQDPGAFGRALGIDPYYTPITGIGASATGNVDDTSYSLPSGLDPSKYYVDGYGNVIPIGMTPYQMPAANTGYENKYDVLSALNQYGFRLNNQGDPSGFGATYLVPDQYKNLIPGNYDANPSEDWGSQIPTALPMMLALGGMTAAGAGLLGGGATSGASAGAAGLADTGGMLSSAGSLGGIGGGTSAAGLGTGTAAAGLGAGTSAVGAPLLGTSELASMFPGAFSSTLAGAAGTAAPSLLSNLSSIPTSPLTSAINSGGGNMALPDIFNAGGGMSIPGVGEVSGMVDLGTGMSLDPTSLAAIGNSLPASDGSTGLFGDLADLLSGNTGSLARAGLSALGSYLQGNAATEAAQTSSDAIIRAAQIAADAAKFRPVGVTTRFGSSNFIYDKNGNVIGAGYGLAPDVKAQQDRLMGMTGGLLGQYEGAQGATAPMAAGAQRAMQLGQGYLGTTPQQQAARYMAEQQALLAPSRERELAAMENRLMQQGRLGLATGGTSTMGASNPEIEALLNARRMQDLNLAAQATQGGMDYAKFGAGMLGTGGDLLKGMYGTQTAAYAPYQTALGGAQTLEQLGQVPMDLGINIGAKGTAANAESGRLLAQGMTNAAQTMQPANAYSPWGSLLQGASNALGQWQSPQQQYRFDPFTGVAL